MSDHDEPPGMISIVRVASYRTKEASPEQIALAAEIEVELGPPLPQMTEAETLEMLALDPSQQDAWLRAWMARRGVGMEGE